MRSNARESSGERGDRRSSSNRSYAELVKWQGTPIRMPLLRLPNDLAPLALECFDCILRYCGDVPLDPELTEVKCVYTVLMVSLHNLAHFIIRKSSYELFCSYH